MKYRKQPVIVDAIRWNSHESYKMLKEIDPDLLYEIRDGYAAIFSNKLPEGVEYVEQGDWIVWELDEIRVYEHDDFLTTHKAV